MSGISIGNLPNQSILKKINDIAADVDNLDLEGVNNLKSKLSELVAPELGNSDEKAISQKIVTENIQRLNTEVNNKISKVESAQNGNLPTFDNGNVRDSKIPSGNLAQQNGYYEGMVVGASRSLAGDNEVRAEYVFRPSGGTDIQSGTASVNRVLGKTLVWNQKFQFDKVSGVTSTHLIYRNKFYNQFPNSHKIFIKFKYNCNEDYPFSKVRIDLSSQGSTYGGFVSFDITKGNNIPYSGIITSNNDTNADLFVRYSNSQEAPIESLTLNPDTIMAIDLTQMFGEGNEPTTVEEFEAMFPNAYYEYNEGTLISNDAVGIKSVGFNAWDEELTDGLISNQGEIVVNQSHLRCKNPIKVLPNTQYYFSKYRNPMLFYWYDSEDKSIEKLYNIDETAKFPKRIAVSPSNARFLRFYI